MILYPIGISGRNNLYWESTWPWQRNPVFLLLDWLNTQCARCNIYISIQCILYTIIHISLIYLHIVHTDYYILVQSLFPRWLIKRTMCTTIRYVLYTIHEHNHINIKAHTCCMKYINTCVSNLSWSLIRKKWHKCDQHVINMCIVNPFHVKLPDLDNMHLQKRSLPYNSF